MMMIIYNKYKHYCYYLHSDNNSEEIMMPIIINIIESAKELKLINDIIVITLKLLDIYIKICN